MKLYATVLALKEQNGKIIQVKKGQGSNTQLNVFINIDDIENHYRLFINKRADGSTDITLVDTTKPFPSNEVFSNTIGKRQKGDCDICYLCKGNNRQHCTACKGSGYNA